MLLCLYNVYKTHADHPVFESDVRRAFQILFETNNEIPTYNGSFIYYDIIKIWSRKHKLIKCYNCRYIIYIAVIMKLFFIKYNC